MVNPSPSVRFFKGGTSLSRVFGITQRFSEDVDLLVTFPTPMGAGARHKAFKAIANDVSAHLCIEAIVPAGGSTYRGEAEYSIPLYM